MTGLVPARVEGNVKAGLLELVDDAVEQGWSKRRACAVLEIDDFRIHRWLQRRAEDRLDDLAPGGNPVHGLLDWEIEAIVELAEAWGEIDRSHRKLAHRGSRLEAVYVSESTMLRVLAAQGLVLPGVPPREPCGQEAVARLGRVPAQSGVGVGRHPLPALRFGWRWRSSISYRVSGSRRS